MFLYFIFLTEENNKNEKSVNFQGDNVECSWFYSDLPFTTIFISFCGLTLYMLHSKYSTDANKNTPDRTPSASFLYKNTSSEAHLYPMLFFATLTENQFLSPQVLGFCLPRNADDDLWVAMVTELGESVDLIKLLQMSWEDRLRVRNHS